MTNNFFVKFFAAAMIMMAALFASSFIIFNKKIKTNDEDFWQKDLLAKAMVEYSSGTDFDKVFENVDREFKVAHPNKFSLHTKRESYIKIYFYDLHINYCNVLTRYFFEKNLLDKKGNPLSGDRFFSSDQKGVIYKAYDVDTAAEICFYFYRPHTDGRKLSPLIFNLYK